MSLSLLLLYIEHTIPIQLFSKSDRNYKQTFIVLYVKIRGKYQHAVVINGTQLKILVEISYWTHRM